MISFPAASGGAALIVERRKEMKIPFLVKCVVNLLFPDPPRHSVVEVSYSGVEELWFEIVDREKFSEFVRFEDEFRDDG